MTWQVQWDGSHYFLPGEHDFLIVGAFWDSLVNSLVQRILLSTSRMANFSKYDGLKLFKLLSLKLKTFLTKSEELQSLTPAQQSYISKRNVRLAMIFLGVGSECLKDAKSQVDFFLKQIMPGNSIDLFQKMILPTNKLTLELFHKTSLRKIDDED